MEKGSKSSSDQDKGSSSPKLKLQKSEHPVWNSGLSGFPKIDRVRLGFEIWFVLERFSRIRVKEMLHRSRPIDVSNN
jgi:hypothetical protein